MTGSPLAVQVPATTANLGAGFDTFGVAMERHLVVAVDDRDDGPRVALRGEGADELPEGDDNLVWQAARVRADELGRDLPDVRLRAVNAIPLARGLGSSSAAIVAGVVLADLLLDVAAPLVDLATTATRLEGHPDNVVPALYGGLTTTATTDRGELVVRRADPHARLGLLVWVPDSQQLTAEARSVLPDTLARTLVGEQVARAGHVLGALMGGWPLDARTVGDRLHEPPRLAVMQGSGALVAALRGSGVPAWLSGAGPSVAAAVPLRDLDGQAAALALGREHGFVGALHHWDRSGARSCPADGCGLTNLADCAACPRRRLA